MVEAQRLRNLIAPFAVSLREKGINGLFLFGSRLRGEHRSDSDVDLFCDIDSEAKLGLFDLMALEADLQSVLGTKVELMSRASLHPLIKDNVQANATRVL
jgi:uncharacterized protein